jgi:transcription antitermination factor NusG
MRESAPINSVAEPNPLASIGSLEQRWYAAYTYPRHEKRVAEYLSGRSVEHFLPLSNYLSRRKDRQKIIQQPLFPSYIFVRLNLRDRLQILGVPGIVNLVSFHGSPEPLPEEDIDALRVGLAQTRDVRQHPFVNAGRRVRIARGPLVGFTGIVRRMKGNLRVILSVELIRRSFLVDVDLSSLEYLVPATQ